MSSDRVDRLEGLTVRVRDGRTLGVVVGVFAEGPPASTFDEGTGVLTIFTTDADEEGPELYMPLSGA